MSRALVGLLTAALIGGCGPRRAPNLEFDAQGENVDWPTADAGGDRNAVPGVLIAFDASASTATYEIVSYEWDFGDGDRAEGMVVSHAYQAPGEYNVTLAIEDEAGRRATDLITVSSAYGNPVATFVVSPTVAEVGEAVYVNASASTSSSPIQSYTWSMGDSSPSVTGVQAVHRYQFGGVFKITLRIEDANGLSSEHSEWIQISGEGEVAAPGPGGIPPEDIEGLFVLSASPSVHQCQSYTVAPPDEMITLSIGTDPVVCEGTIGTPFAGLGNNGSIYEGCFDGEYLSLSFDQAGLTPGGGCQTGLQVSLGVNFSDANQFSGHVTSFYDSYLGCQCSALFSVTGSR